MDQELQELFNDTKIAFEKSPIKKFADDKSAKWAYTISSTELQQGKNLLVEFNWEVESKQKYTAQEFIPTINFKGLHLNKELGSLQKIYRPLLEYFPAEEIDDAVRSNFCFFRSKQEDQLTQTDLDLSTPLFLKFIDIIKPKSIIGFSNNLKNYFIYHKLCSDLQKLEIPSNKRMLLVAKGIFKRHDQNIPIYFLPHPDAKLTSSARKEAWNFCFKEN